MRLTIVFPISSLPGQLPAFSPVCLKLHKRRSQLAFSSCVRLLPAVVSSGIKYLLKFGFSLISSLTVCSFFIIQYYQLGYKCLHRFVFIFSFQKGLFVTHNLSSSDNYHIGLLINCLTYQHFKIPFHQDTILQFRPYYQWRSYYDVVGFSTLLLYLFSIFFKILPLCGLSKINNTHLNYLRSHASI